MAILTDTFIQELLKEPKILPLDYRTRLELKKRKDEQQNAADLDIGGINGHKFEIKLRQAILDPMDFSVILVYIDEKTNEHKILTRYNGLHGPTHTNKIEGTKIKQKCHIHMATERYQREGHRIETYAVETQSYSSFSGALDRFIQDLNFNYAHQKRLDLEVE